MARGFSSKEWWVLAREPCLQEQIKWGNTEPSLKSFKFEETAKKEKRERFHEMSIMVAGRNIKSQFNLGKSKPVFLFFSPYSSEFCANRVKSLTLPMPAPPQTSHFVFVKRT